MKPFKSILYVCPLVVDYKASLHSAIQLAEKLDAKISFAMNLGHKNNLLDLHDLLPSYQKYHDDLVAAAEKQLKTITKKVNKNNLGSTYILSETPWAEITRLVLENGFDLVIKPVETDGKSWLKQLLTGTDQKLVRNCSCPVWFLNSTKADHKRRILAAVDVESFKPEDKESMRMTADRIIETAVYLAWQQKAKLLILNTWEIQGEDKLKLWLTKGQLQNLHKKEKKKRNTLLQEAVTRVWVKLDPEIAKKVKPEVKVVQGSASKTILQAAKSWAADLTILGTMSRKGPAGWIIGNTAENVLGSIRGSVLTIQPKPFETRFIQ